MFNFEKDMNTSSSRNKARRESFTWQLELRYGKSGTKSEQTQSLGPATTSKAAKQDIKVATTALPKIGNKKWTKSPEKKECPSKPEVRKGYGSNLRSGSLNLEQRTEKKADDDSSSSFASKNETLACKSMDGGESKESYKGDNGLNTNYMPGLHTIAEITPNTEVVDCEYEPSKSHYWAKMGKDILEKERRRVQMNLDAALAK